MGRAIGGAIVGYVAIFATIFLLFTGLWFALGEGGAFRPGAWELSPTWIAIAQAVVFVAGLAGGALAAKVGRSPLAVRLCAGLALVLGIVLSLPILTGSIPPGPMPRPANLPTFEAMGHAVPPAWTAIVQPILTALGALVGGRPR